MRQDRRCLWQPGHGIPAAIALRGLLRMRNSTDGPPHPPHAEEHPKGASRSTAAARPPQEVDVARPTVLEPMTCHPCLRAEHLALAWTVSGSAACDRSGPCPA